MKVVIDSYSLLAAIGGHKEAFTAIDALVKKQSIAMLAAQLKHKSLDLVLYRSIADAVGIETLELFFDTPDEKLLKTIAKKIDPHSSKTADGDADALRLHLIKLAIRDIEPAAKAGKAQVENKKRARHSGDSEPTDRPHAIATKPPRR